MISRIDFSHKGIDKKSFEPKQMSRVLNLRCTLRTSNIFAVRFTRCSYSSDKGSDNQNENTTNTTGTVDEEAVQPLSMSYNSYENLSSVQTTPPILIMHGVYNKSI